MPAIKLLNIFALSTFATLLCSFGPSQTLALSINSNHLPRQLPNHHGIAKKKRATKRCKPRSSSSSVPNPTSTPKEDPSPSSTQPPVYVESPAPTSTPVPTSTLASTPTNTPTGPGKLAVAWALGNDPRIHFFIESSRVKMFNLWGPQIPTAIKDSGIPASIMLWGPGQNYIDDFVKYAQPGYASYAFGFNEVNEPGQANMLYQVDLAVSLWNQHLRPLADHGYTLGSPCTSSNPNGYPWMVEFFDKCGSDCHVDEMSIHWYDVKFEDLVDYVNKWAGFKKPIRVTEYACTSFTDAAQPDMGQVWDFTTKAIDFFENNAQILSYAPFGAMDSMVNVDTDNQLFVPYGNTLTDLGWRYVNGN